jgi:MFS transporter, PAT family, beta-lactamase induction signal transducer AmpG
LREIGFDLATIGLVNKTVSFVSAILGGFVAGILMTYLSLYRALILFGFIQRIANLSYAMMAYWGKSLFLLVLSVFIENFCSGMGTIALLALITTLCHVDYTATQFALFNAIAFLARTFLGPLAAVMIHSIGWVKFFIACFLISLPALFFIYINKNIIQQLKNTIPSTKIEGK